MRRWAPLILLASVAGAQTPPIQPKTPDVRIPAPITLPSPKEKVIGEQPLTADEAAAIALRNQPLIGIARGSLLSGQGRVEQTASDLLPNFNLAGSFSETRNLRGGGTGQSNRFSTSASVDQLLFDFGRTRDALRQQQALERGLRNSLSRTEQTVTLDVKEAFYDYVQSLASVDIGESNVANRTRQLDQAQARLTAGLGPPSDLVQAKTNLAEAVLSLTSARTAALAAQIDLARLMGIDPRTPIKPAASGEKPLDAEADLQALVDRAMAIRPDVRAAMEQLAAAKYGVSLASKGNLPRVTASVGAGSRGVNDPFASETATFGINLVWNFADSGFTAGAVKSARGGEEIAKGNLVLVSRQAVSEVGKAYIDVQSAVQRIELASVEVSNAQELVRISEGRFSGGLGSFLEVTNAQASLVAAQRSLVQAKQDLERARVRMRVAVGLPGLP